MGSELSFMQRIHIYNLEKAFSHSLTHSSKKCIQFLPITWSKDMCEEALAYYREYNYIFKFKCIIRVVKYRSVNGIGGGYCVPWILKWEYGKIDDFFIGLPKFRYRSNIEKYCPPEKKWNN